MSSDLMQTDPELDREELIALRDIRNRLVALDDKLYQVLRLLQEMQDEDDEEREMRH